MTEALVRARGIKLLTCDVDGVLTDGRIYVDDLGQETKAFHALDGVGMHLLGRAGIVVAWITGSPAPAVEHRARRLNVPYVMLDIANKLEAWSALRERLRIAPEACAHIGDYLPDVRFMRGCGLAATVRHAPAAVREHAHYVTMRDGGQGAVRELAELILAAQGHTPQAAPVRAA
jgi:3-deoxy-D-manno-octulosonate 8-phosphate phosphatase (KDO 8-P phosphatase)